MKVAFISSRLEGTNLERANKIISTIESTGAKVDKSMLRRSLDEELQDVESIYKDNLKSIKSSDLLIADTTQYSAGIGYLVAMAMTEKKPVLAIHYEKSENIHSVMLKGAKSPLLSYIDYNEDNVGEIVTSYLNDIKGKLDTKFILIISPKIDKYLKWAADERRLHKAQVVREAVDQMMKKDKEYKEHLKEVEA